MATDDTRGRSDASLSVFPMATVKRTTMATQRVCILFLCVSVNWLVTMT